MLKMAQQDLAWVVYQIHMILGIQIFHKSKKYLRFKNELKKQKRTYIWLTDADPITSRWMLILLPPSPQHVKGGENYCCRFVSPFFFNCELYWGDIG